MNKQNKITITLASEQCEILNRIAKRRGYTASQMCRDWIVDRMDSDGLLPDLHGCPQCHKECYGLPNQICPECEKLIPPEE